jgi:hypothetical protein
MRPPPQRRNGKAAAGGIRRHGTRYPDFDLDGPAVNSAVDSGKTRFRRQKLPPRRRESSSIQRVEPIFMAPADSGNRAPFAVLGSGPAVEFNGMFQACWIRHDEQLTNYSIAIICYVGAS